MLTPMPCPSLSGLFLALAAQALPVALEPTGIVGPPARALPSGVPATLDLTERGTPIVVLSDADLPDVRVAGTWIFLAGRRYAPQQSPDLPLWLARLLAAELDRERLAELGAEVSFAVDFATLSLRYRAPSAALDELFALLAALVREPTYGEDDWAALAAELATEPAPSAEEELLARIDELAYGQSYARHAYARAGVPRALPALADLRQHQALALGADRAWLGAAAAPGATERARAALLRAAELLPAGTPPPRVADARPFEGSATPRVLLYDRPGSEAALGFAGPAAGSSPAVSAALREGFAARGLSNASPACPEIVARPDGDARGDWRLLVSGAPAAVVARALELQRALSGPEPAGGDAAAHPAAELERAPFAALEALCAGRSLSDSAAEVPAGTSPDGQGVADPAAALRAASWEALVDPERWLVVAVGPAAELAEPLAALGPVLAVDPEGARGDSAAAVAALARLFEALGGRARWAALESFRLENEVSGEGLAEPLRATVWQRIEPLGVRLEQKGPDGKSTTIVREDASFTLTEKTAQPSDPDRHRALVGAAQRALPRVLQRLASDRTLRALFVSTDVGQRLEFFDADRQRAWAWFELAADGRPARLGFGLYGPDGPAYEYADWQDAAASPTLARSSTSRAAWPRARASSPTPSSIQRCSRSAASPSVASRLRGRPRGLRSR